MNSKNLYNDSEFKTIDRETSLIIPVNKIRNSTLYIRIPCNDICDYKAMWFHTMWFMKKVIKT